MSETMMINGRNIVRTYSIYMQKKGMYIHATPSPILESSTVNFDLLKDKTPAPECSSISCLLCCQRNSLMNIAWVPVLQSGTSCFGSWSGKVLIRILLQRIQQETGDEEAARKLKHNSVHTNMGLWTRLKYTIVLIQIWYCVQSPSFKIKVPA